MLIFFKLLQSCEKNISVNNANHMDAVVVEGLKQQAAMQCSSGTVMSQGERGNFAAQIDHQTGGYVWYITRGETSEERGMLQGYDTAQLWLFAWKTSTKSSIKSN